MGFTWKSSYVFEIKDHEAIQVHIFEGESQYIIISSGLQLIFQQHLRWELHNIYMQFPEHEWKRMILFQSESLQGRLP